jgi:hypothetical protein
LLCMYTGIHVKMPIIFVTFQWNLNFLNRLLKIIAYQISCKSFKWEPSCSVRTETTKLIAAFRNFANAPVNYVVAITSFDGKSRVHENHSAVNRFVSKLHQNKCGVTMRTAFSVLVFLDHHNTIHWNSRKLATPDMFTNITCIELTSGTNLHGPTYIKSCASSGTLFRTRRDHCPVTVRSGRDVETSNYLPENS